MNFTTLRKFTRPISVTVLTNFGILLANAAGGVIVARTLGPSKLGQLALVVLVTSSIHTFGSTGHQSSVTYHAARWREKTHVLMRWYRTVIIWQIIFQTAFAGASMFMLHTFSGVSIDFCIVFVGWPAGATVALYGVCYAQGIADHSVFNGLRVISGALPAVLMVAASIFWSLTPTEIGECYVSPVIFAGGLAAKYIWSAGKKKTDNLRLTSSEKRSIWSYGWRSIASLTSTTMNKGADKMVVGVLIPSSGLGLYSVASSVGTPISIIPAGLSMVGLPAVAKENGRNKVLASRRVVRRGAIVLGIVAPLMCAVVPFAIPFVYGDKFIGAVGLAEVLTIGAVFESMNLVYDGMLQAFNRPGFISTSQGIGGIVTLVGAILLARRSLFGVAIISMLGFATTSVLAGIRLHMVASSTLLDDVN